MSIVYRLSLPVEEYVAGEDIRLDRTLENRGAAPVELPDPDRNRNWQPTYTLEGPGPGEVRTWDFRSLARGRPAAPPPASEAALMTLGAGATWASPMSLSDLVPLVRPGRYVVRSRLTWGEIDVEADPAAFTVKPLRTADAGVGADVLPGDDREIYAAWIDHDEGGAQAVFQALFVKRRSTAAEIGRRAVIRIAATGKTATDPLSPVAHHARSADLFNWVAWREGREMVAVPADDDTPVRVALDFDPAQVLRPALLHEDRDLDVLVAGASTLALVRFEDAKGAGSPSGSVRWSAPLPAPIAAGAAAAEPGSRRLHVALTARDPRGVRVLHGVSDGRSPPRFAEALVEDAVLLADGPPALLALRSGAARVGVVVAAPGDRARCRLVEVVFDAGSPADGEGSVTPIDLPARAVSARVGYCPDGPGFHRAWVVRTTDGALHTPHGSRAPSAEVEPWAGLCLVVLGQAAYLLEPSPLGGLDLRPL